MARKAIAVKKYVVTLSDDERDQLNAMINKGKRPARQQLQACILLKADASGAGEDHRRAPSAWMEARLEGRGCPSASST